MFLIDYITIIPHSTIMILTTPDGVKHHPVRAWAAAGECALNLLFANVQEAVEANGMMHITLGEWDAKGQQDRYDALWAKAEAKQKQSRRKHRSGNKPPPITKEEMNMTVKEILNVLYSKQVVTITSGCIYPTEVSGCVECMLEMLSDKVLDANVKSVSIDDDEATITWQEDEQ